MTFDELIRVLTSKLTLEEIQTLWDVIDVDRNGLYEALGHYIDQQDDSFFIKPDTSK